MAAHLDCTCRVNLETIVYGNVEADSWQIIAKANALESNQTYCITLETDNKELIKALTNITVQFMRDKDNMF